MPILENALDGPTTRQNPPDGLYYAPAPVRPPTARLQAGEPVPGEPVPAGGGPVPAGSDEAPKITVR